jgi:hypothetical protein
MKQLEYLYFNIYNHYSKRSFYPDDSFVRLVTIYILSLSAGGWVLLLEASFLRLVRHVWFTTQSGAMMFAVTVYLVIGCMFHWIFIVNGHDQKILSKFAHSNSRNSNKKTGLILSAIIAVAPYILLASLKIFFPRS